MVQERLAYANNDIVPESQAKVTIGDLGFRFGDADLAP